MRYPGGKGKCFQQIINLFPPHHTYIETHLGGGAVLRNKRAAPRSIGIDKDERVITFFRHNHPDLAEFLHGDSIDFLRTFPFKGSELVYCDPPYLPSTRKRTRVYRHDYEEKDHCVLLETILKLPCFVVISGYASDLYGSKLAGWCMTRFAYKAHDGLREECLWSNYPIPEQLHDSRYLGTNYRERQNFKRRMGRLRKRIALLSRVEQHEIAQWLSLQLQRRDEQCKNSVTSKVRKSAGYLFRNLHER